MTLLFSFDVVGGPFDGVALATPAWADDGSHPPPDLIFVGTCRRGACGSAKCGKRPSMVHVSYWEADEQRRPPDAFAYEKQDEFVTRSEADELLGRAVYAIGGLGDPRNFGVAAREPVGVPAALVGEPMVARWLEGWPPDRRAMDRRRGSA